MINKYRKKPVVVEAVQWTGNKEAIDEFARYNVKVDSEDIISIYDYLHGVWIPLSINDWIIKGVQGEFYPCKPDIFESTYELIP